MKFPWLKKKNIAPELVHEDARRELGRRHISDFTSHTFPGYQTAPHNQLLCKYLDRWVSGEISRLMVFMPPRHGKSELVSRRLPSFILGKIPTAQVLAVSYAQSLANSMSRSAKAIFSSDYFKDLFPMSGLSSKRNAVDEWENAAGGIYKCAGVGGGITGRGFDFGIIDDPIKDRKEAESETVRSAVWDWYTSTFYTRQQPGARILITQTRWHEDDLSGRLLKAAKQDSSADEWTVLVLPAEAAEGDAMGRAPGQALWPDRFPSDKLSAIRANIGTYDWQALYQQSPSPPGGSKINPAWFKLVELEPDNLSWVRYWDLAVSVKKSADFTASVALAVSESGIIYLKDMVRGRWIWPDTRKIMAALSRVEGIPIGIESAGQQQGFVDDLTRDPELAGVSIRGIRPSADKLTRALPWIARAESGQVCMVEGKWIGDFLSECARFTGRGNSHDDQIDCVSGAYHMAAAFGPKMFLI